MNPLVVVAFIKTVSEANAHEHWRARQKRAKAQRSAALILTSSYALQAGVMVRRGGAVELAGPMVVTLTRIAPRALDSDNLAGSAKHVRDGVADALGIDDRNPIVEWRYAQRRGAPKQYAVEIRIEPKGST